MADALSITLHPLGEESAAGAGTAVDIGTSRTAVLLEAMVAAMGAEFGLQVQTSPNGTDAWEPVGSFGAILKAGTVKLAFGPCRRFVRVSWALTGAARFSVQGEAHVLYAELQDLNTGGVRPEALEDIETQVKVHALLSATADLDAAFRSRFKLPLASWGQDVRGRAVSRAIYYCFRHRGFDPESGQDALVVADGGFLMGDGRSTALERWLRDVSTAQVHPDVVDSTPAKREFGARVRSKPRRDQDDC